MVYSDTHADATVITLLPNRSATWAQTRIFLFIICGMTLAIGVFWAFIGAWLVLPFSGLEAALVAWVLYRVSYGTYQRQVITCSPRYLLVQIGARFPKRSWQLERERAHLSVTDARHPLDAIQLRLVDGNHSIELGGFLNRDDKAAALRALKRAGLQVRSSNPDGELMT
ncbi:MAG: DUF2244 domain-containing protein [Pseudomonadota bacterium]|nr:DUF2244 domain-containing protein [Pseudomonadota bacterium]